MPVEVLTREEVERLVREAVEKLLEETGLSRVTCPGQRSDEFARYD